MAKIWFVLELLNLVVFTVFIIPRRQPENAKALIPASATTMLRIMWLLPILAFGFSLFIPHPVMPLDWVCLVFAFTGTLLVIKGKRDLGNYHTWAGYYLPGAPALKRGIFRWIAHPMYTGIILVIISCSLVYLARLPGYLSAIVLACCLYIVSFLLIVAGRESKHLARQRAL